MHRGRENHACATRGKDVFVIGGEESNANSIDIWNGKFWKYLIGPIGGTFLRLFSQNKNIYLFGGWEKQIITSITNKIWKIDPNNTFTNVGETSMSRIDYTLFSIPSGFLTNCGGT